MRIISDSEARQILKRDLKRQAQERHAAQLESADSEERQGIMDQIEREVEKELRQRGLGKKRGFFSGLLYPGDGLLH